MTSETTTPANKLAASPQLGDSAHTLYLVDISSFIFRAFFAIRHLSTPQGEPANAVYGVAQMLARLADDARPAYLAVVYDSKESSFRKEIYPEYKANRSETPPDLIPQFARIEEMISAFQIHSYRQSGIEADDLIATLTRVWCEKSPENRVVVVSSDKDLMQLVDDRVYLWDTMNDKIYAEPQVVEKFGVKPTQIRDYLALVGDSSDNIPGVPSIGPKTASDLLKEYGDLTAILAAAASGKISGKKGKVLVDHKADALLSADLATVRDQLPVVVEQKDLTYSFHVDEKCTRFLTDMGFQSLLNRWRVESKTHEAPPLEDRKRSHERSHESSDGQSAAPSVAPPATFRTVNTAQAMEDLLKRLASSSAFGFDLETTSLNPREAEIVGFSFSTDLDSADYIPVGHRGTSVEQLPLQEVMNSLKPFLEDPKKLKVGQNLKYDWSVLYAQGVSPAGIGADTMVAAYVLNPEGRHNLETISQTYLNYKVTTYEQVCGKGKDQIGFDLVPIDQATRYSAEDSWVAMKLWAALKTRLDEQKTLPILNEVDLPLVDVLARMEMQGVSIDVDYLKKLSAEYSLDLKKIEEKIFEYARPYSLVPINLNSTKQLAQLLFEHLGLPTQSKTKTGFSTDASVLEALSGLHEVPRLLLEYREITKLKGTYIDTLPLMRDAQTGKIHASFHQTVAATGRLSSSDPNLQNIPIRSDRGMRIRGAFVASEGNLLLSADYSQIELRLLAHMSGDPELTRSFRENEDVHRRTAGEIFEIPADQVDDRQRSIAKAINFGLMYGKTAFGLSQELGISRGEAQDTINRYFRRYSAVKSFLDQQILDAKERGWVQTLLGRKRYLPDIQAKNAAIRQNAERIAMNSPIQGTAADLMKLAMIQIDSEIARRKMGSRLIIQVHDEVVLDCPEGEIDEARALVEKIMITAGDQTMKLSVPLTVNSGVGKTWLEL
jgi:DNA polymerase-1